MIALLNRSSYSSQTLGRRQAVRHRILIPAFGGSIPPAPANFLKLVRNPGNLQIESPHPREGEDPALVWAQSLI
jgi:hypothetical protein